MPPRTHRTATTTRQALRAVAAELAANQRASQWVCWVPAGFAVVLAVFAVLVKNAPVAAYLGFGVVIVMCLAAAASLFLTLRRPPQEHEAYQVLRERADEIVWTYVKRDRFCSIVLALGDGTRFDLPVRLQGEQRVLALVAALAPTAHVGYRPELERAWNRDPSLGR